MIAIARFLAMTAMLGLVCTAWAATTTLGSSSAQQCYESATVGGRPADADLCTEAIKSEDLTRGDLAATYSNRGILLAAGGHLDQALEDHDQAIALDPESARAFVNRGNTHYRLKNYDKALDDYSHAIELTSGTFPPVFYNRALAYLAVGNRAAARADLERAIALAPQSALYRDTLTALPP